MSAFSSWLSSSLTLMIAVAIVAILVRIYLLESALTWTNTKTAGSSSRFGDSDLDILVKWIEKHDGFIDSRIIIRNGPVGRGVFLKTRDADDQDTTDTAAAAAAVIENDTKLYMVSENCFLSLQTIQDASKSVFVPVLNDPEFQDLLENDTIQLALALLAEYNTPNSFWRPYLDTIPKEYPDQPLFWSESELLELQSPWVVRQIQMSRKFLQSKQPYLIELSQKYPLLFPIRNKSNNNDGDDDDSYYQELVQDFAWAYYTITSRAFDVGRPDQPNKILGLVPFVDLLNHAFSDKDETVIHTYVVHMPGNVAFFTGIPQQSLLPLQPGTELAWKYNDAVETTRFLYSYGMLDDDYENNVQGDFIVLNRIINGKELPWPVNSAGFVDSAMFAQDDSGLSKEQIIKTIAEKVQTAIHELPTTLEKDKKTLQSSLHTTHKHSPSLRVALLLRIRYKQVLHRLLTWLEGGAVYEVNQDTTILKQDDVKSSRALYHLNI